VCKQKKTEIVEGRRRLGREHSNMKDGGTTRGLPINTSNTAKAELMEVLRDSSLHNNDKNSSHNNKSSNNNKVTVTVIDNSNEMLSANTAVHNNNIERNVSTANACQTVAR
jgi:hypothetical protein